MTPPYFYRTSETHWSMNTGIAALVAGSGKVKMICMIFFYFYCYFVTVFFFCWKSEDSPYVYLITLFLFYDRDYKFYTKYE